MGDVDGNANIKNGQEIIDQNQFEDEFIWPQSNIDYTKHIYFAKLNALKFRLPGKHHRNVLKPIPEDQNDVSHYAYKCVFKRCRSDLKFMSINDESKQDSFIKSNKVL